MKADIDGSLERADEEDWDGEGAAALDLETVEIAKSLVDELPSHVFKPDVDAFPHGEIDFDWVVGQDVMLTVSVLPSRYIAFSFLFGDSRSTGRDPWKGSLPRSVRFHLEELRDYQGE